MLVQNPASPRQGRLRNSTPATYWRWTVAGLQVLSLVFAPLAGAQEPPATQEDGQKTEDGSAKPADKPVEKSGEKTPEKAPDKPGEKPADAAPAKAAGGSLLDQLDDGTLPAVAPAPPAPSPFQLEWHGYFRFRPDVISNGHLGQAEASTSSPSRPVSTSAVPPPLSLWPANNDPSLNPQSTKVGAAAEENSLAGASIRLRLMPTITIERDVRIAMTLDVLDNVLLGGNPDYAGAVARPDVPLVGFTMGAKPGTIAIKEAYGEWKTMLGVLRVGRQASHWGMGLLAHGGAGDGWDLNRPGLWYGGPRRTWEGQGYDVDGGNYSDRAAFVTKIPKAGLYLSVFYDFLANGAQGYDPARVDVQARNLSGSDDVRQYGLVVMSRPLSDDDAAERQKALEDERKGVLDWGLYGVYRTQKNDIADSSKLPSSEIDLTNADDAQLLERKATAYIADAWMRYEKRFSPLRRLVVEGELAGIFGSVGDTNTLPGQAAKPRDLNMWGGALKSAFQDEGMGYMLDLGVASGDDTRCFGVFGSPGCSLDTADGKPNTEISGFKFNRNFHVDHLLFREIVGSVTNAIYARPAVSVNAYPWYSPELLGIDLSALYAIAMTKEGTPGAGSNIGAELAARAFIGRRGQAFADVVFAYALPGDAFNLKEGWNGVLADKSPENAWRLTGHVVLTF